jgi:hypothetical protein
MMLLAMHAADQQHVTQHGESCILQRYNSCWVVNWLHSPCMQRCASYLLVLFG